MEIIRFHFTATVTLLAVDGGVKSALLSRVLRAFWVFDGGGADRSFPTKNQTFVPPKVFFKSQRCFTGRGHSFDSTSWFVLFMKTTKRRPSAATDG